MAADKHSCSPENLQGVASELRRLADQIAVGQLTVGGVTLTLCNTVAVKVKQKLVRGEVKFDLSLTASLADQGPAHSEQAASPSLRKAVPPEIVKTTSGSRPYALKKLKKDLSRQWKQISTAIGTAESPSPLLQQDFLQTCEEYGRSAADQWHPQWQESVATMKELLALAQEGNFQEASRLLALVNNQRKACHAKYK